LGRGIDALRGRSLQLRRSRCIEGWCCWWRLGWERRLEEKSAFELRPRGLALGGVIMVCLFLIDGLKC
jgi:hypothetical protein